jgi:NADH-quinone oxidoreductase subunit N
MKVTTILQDLQFFYPEITLTVTILAIIIIELVIGQKNRLIIPLVSAAGLIISAIFSLQLLSVPEHFIFSNMIIIDKLGIFFRVFFSIATTIIVILSYETFKRSGEYYILLISAVFGMYLMATSTHIASIVLALEIVGISCYVLAGYNRNELRSSEASLKYMLYGAVSTGVMLYGFSFLYGLTGETNLYMIRASLPLTVGFDTMLLFVSVLFIFAGIGYKIAIVPFHFWCPDVYEGSPTPVTTFFSVVPKVAGIALLARFLFAGLSEQLSPVVEQWVIYENMDLPFLLAILSAVTMTLGNLAALGQTNVKRLLAYSSIAHAGFILMGFTVFNGFGLNAVLFYSVVYMFMNFGAFILVDAIASRINSENIKDFKGLWKRAPYMSILFTIFLVSLTGLPPTAGFIGKFLIFFAVIEAKLYWLAVIGALNSVVSLYYYFRIPKAMFLSGDPVDSGKITFSGIHLSLATLLMIPTLYFGVLWGWLIKITSFGINFLVAVK